MQTSLSQDLSIFTQGKVSFPFIGAQRVDPHLHYLYSRLQPWIMFFIDAASFLVIDDNWKFFVVYEKYNDDEGRTRYAVVGYCTVYQYFSYPENIRPKYVKYPAVVMTFLNQIYHQSR